MKHSRAAIRYAKAVLSLSLDLKNADKVNEDMHSISTTIETSNELKAMLSSPVIKPSVKKSALLAVFTKLDKTTISLIDQLITNNRLPLFNLIAKQFIILYDKHKGTEIATVTTAVPLTKELEVKVLSKIKEIVGTKVSLNKKIDPSLIGGFILRVGDKQFDASISGKMKSLRKEFENKI